MWLTGPGICDPEPVGGSSVAPGNLTSYGVPMGECLQAAGDLGLDAQSIWAARRESTQDFV